MKIIKLNYLLFFILFIILPVSVTAYERVLILSPDEFIDELQPLKTFKDYSARPATLLSLSQVYSTYSGVDNPEKIKKCIEHHVKTKGVNSVLLVGDINKFPVRWRWWGRWMPNDPYFRGTWGVVSGEYRQTDATTKRQFCSWIDVSPYQEYTIDVDCKPLGGDATQRQLRINFADADRAGCRHRVDLLPNKLRLVQCGSVVDKNLSFNLNQSYHIKIELKAGRIKVWVNNVQQEDRALTAMAASAYGKIGLGTYFCSAGFDNLKIITNTITLVDENFNDGVANGFTEAPTMEERSWMVSDLYYADLYKSDKSFDDWDYNNNNLFGEIEFRLPVYNPTAVLNNDRINYLPDVAVGRVPAADEEQVTRYVKKVIWYECMTKRNAPWFKKAVLYEGTTGGGAHNDNIATNLQGKGFTVYNRRWTGDLKNYTNAQRKQIVVDNINQGFGFINYLGHGNTGEWSCVNFTHSEVKTQLTNTTMLPIVAAGACNTGQFGPIPPADAYIDVNDVTHSGTSAGCERFPGPPEFPHYALPKAMQINYNRGCIGEDFIFHAGDPKGTGGAIAYLGERSGGRDGGNLLTEYFFKAYKNKTTIGAMWEKMVTDYYWAKNIDKSHTWAYGPEKWADGHYFDEAQKFILFGDPSVIVGGNYNINLSGNVHNGSSPAILAYDGYRVTGDITIPAGQTLTIDSTVTFLFESGRKMTAMDTSPQKGFIKTSWYPEPSYFLAAPKSPSTSDVLCGMKISGEMRIRNGGQIKFY